MNLPTTTTHQIPDLERMARAFSASKLFGVKTPEEALALCLIAQSEGRHPASAAQDYHIINGRPAKKAESMLRDFIASGGTVEWHALDDAKADATFSHPSGGTVRISWDMARASKAAINNPMWKKYPRQMLRSRVVSEGVRTVCPGATSGMLVVEEAQDLQPRDVTPRLGVVERPSVVERLNLQSSVVEVEAEPEPDYEANLEASADVSLDALKAAWTATPTDVQRRLGREYLDSLKARAEALEAVAEPAEDLEAMF
jgi:hypothetical protein